ncbi:hypothetical protein [Micropruina sp.]|uniref:hypothetical protein n=1 Tax=Micropruina sp. TaxID=2737536 RepID=UPI00261B93E4|nr:hypothetical protein [Micropruina sp.]
MPPDADELGSHPSPSPGEESRSRRGDDTRQSAQYCPVPLRELGVDAEYESTLARFGS